MVDNPGNKSFKKLEAQATKLAQKRVGRNVDTLGGDVESCRVTPVCGALSQDPNRSPIQHSSRGDWARFVGALLCVVMLLVMGASGCVDTAECNASVTCPAGKVCYEYECHIRCESSAQCGEEQVCAPCQTISGTHDQGKCFGADLKACIDENL